MMQCPVCGKNNNIPTKSWQYWIFRVDAYSCECGAKFRNYRSMQLDLKGNSDIAKGKLVEHSFILLHTKGRQWERFPEKKR